MLLWLLAYALLGQLLLPVALGLLGIERDELSARGHALLHLSLDVAQLAATAAILWGCLRRYRPRQLGLFPARLRGLWPLAVAACCAAFPAVDWVAHQSVVRGRGAAACFYMGLAPGFEAACTRICTRI
jgi:hypothetical protein